MQLVLSPTRRRKSFLKHKYAETITIREIDKDRPTPRVIKIPATLQSAKARLMIIATKTLDRMERRLDLLADADAQMTPKEYKEFSEGLEKVSGMVNEAFGVSPALPAPTAPVNNTIINVGTNAAELSNMMRRATAKAVGAPPPIDIPQNDTGRNPPDPREDRPQDGS